MCVVEDGQNDVLHEAVGPALRHLKNQPGKVVRIGLQQIEKVLVRLQKRESEERKQQVKMIN